MENWNNYVSQGTRYGNMYVFEDNQVKSVCFYDRLNSLNESADDFDTFLLEWDKSVEYLFNNLDEQSVGDKAADAYWDTTAQAYQLLQKAVVNPSTKAVGSVLGFAKKLKDSGALGKVGGHLISGLVGGAAAIGAYHLVNAGADPNDFAELAQQAADIVPEIGQDVAQVAKQPEALSDLVDKQAEISQQAAQSIQQVAPEASQEITDLEKQLEALLSQSIDMERVQDITDAESAAASGADTQIPLAHLNIHNIDPKIFNEYGPNGQEILDLQIPEEVRQTQLDDAKTQWMFYKKMAKGAAEGQSLEDIGWSKQEFKQWTRDIEWAPDKIRNKLKNFRRFSAMRRGADDPGYGDWFQGWGYIPSEHVDMLKKAVLRGKEL